MTVVRWGDMRRQVADPGLLVTYLGAGVILLLFVLYPALRVLIYPSWQDYLSIAHSVRWMHADRNSLVMMVISTISETLLGLVFAFATTRADLPDAGSSAKPPCCRCSRRHSWWRLHTSSCSDGTG